MLLWLVLLAPALALPGDSHTAEVRAWCDAVLRKSAAESSSKVCAQGDLAKGLLFNVGKRNWFHEVAYIQRVPQFMSNVDWWLWQNDWKYKARGFTGVYVDLAANDPISRSTTFFADACLGWRGICVEANPWHYQRLESKRTCDLEKYCVSDRAYETTFVVPNDDYRSHRLGGSASLSGQSRAHPNGAQADEKHKEIKVTCTTLSQILSVANLDHVDYLSLDIEGHEVPAFSTVDFSKVRIDVIVSENAEIFERFLKPAGYRNVLKLGLNHIYAHANYTLGIERQGRKPVCYPSSARKSNKCTPVNDWLAGCPTPRNTN
ncbi:hypothetical protein M885DRAFT_553334 [Pelagophyceae sp. CCMP2097]|nr:hypothetical protein M885DRAFT_553334 [Pelagophyceae sp. CCMP2097]